MTKITTNPFVSASIAAIYIVVIVFIISKADGAIEGENILIPMIMLGLFVLSAAVMGFLFISEPFHLYFEGKKKEAMTYFVTALATFAFIVIVFSAVVLLVSR